MIILNEYQPIFASFSVVCLCSVVLGHDFDKLPGKRWMLGLSYPKVGTSFVHLLILLHVLLYDWNNEINRKCNGVLLDHSHFKVSSRFKKGPFFTTTEFVCLFWFPPPSKCKMMPSLLFNMTSLLLKSMVKFLNPFCVDAFILTECPLSYF